MLKVCFEDFKSENTIYMLLEFKKTNLYELLNNIRNNNSTKLTKKQKLKIIYEIACGLQVLHANYIVHLDLNPMNILVNDNLEEVVITEFGLSKLGRDTKGLKNTLTITELSSITFRYSPLE